MPVPADVFLVAVHWKFQGGIEEAVTTFHVYDPSGTGADATLLAENVATSLVARWNSTNLVTHYNDKWQCDLVEVYRLNPDGSASDKGVAFPVAMFGATNTLQLPLEVACVVSKYGYQANTLVPQPARKRGRLYMPAPNVQAVNNLGFFSFNFVTAVAEFWELVWEDVNLPAGARTVVILSKAGTDINAIVRLVVNDVPDTQRRRGASLFPAIIIEKQVDQG